MDQEMDQDIEKDMGQNMDQQENSAVGTHPINPSQSLRRTEQ